MDYAADAITVHAVGGWFSTNCEWGSPLCTIYAWPNSSCPKNHPVDITDPEPTTDKEPETQQIPTKDFMPEPVLASEPEPTASSVPEEVLEVPSYQVCEPAITSVPVGILVELEEEEWLIDWEAEECLDLKD